ncbi:sporulation related protein [Gillisia mitskevichiae]|uniref:Sporulation related protein n=1 Tax=Gillisia mitskevichiae TaxID=270921 RepID=A0A495PZI1_9FLAO|nr:SPOR domain-containing protein [Gillisia mitskevichiae]RKS55930.1 sporulation related protein [Gillisia mitskevichiae]
MRILKIKDCFFICLFLFGMQQIAVAQTGKVSIQQDANIPNLLEMKSEMTKDGKFGERYKIQLYYGDNNSASDVIKRFRSLYSEWPSQIIYETPNYKVWIGNFRNRLEADRALMKVKGDFPSAFIPKPQRS